MPGPGRRCQLVLIESVDSERLAGVHIEAELLFYKLLLVSDDKGRYRGSAFKVGVGVFSSRMESGSVTANDLDDWIDQLEGAGLIARYEGEDGGWYLHITNLHRPIRNDRSAVIRFPAPPTADQLDPDGCRLDADGKPCPPPTPPPKPTPPPQMADIPQPLQDLAKDAWKRWLAHLKGMKLRLPAGEQLQLMAEEAKADPRGYLRRIERGIRKGLGSVPDEKLGAAPLHQEPTPEESIKMLTDEARKTWEANRQALNKRTLEILPEQPDRSQLSAGHETAKMAEWQELALDALDKHHDELEAIAGLPIKFDLSFWSLQAHPQNPKDEDKTDA